MHSYTKIRNTNWNNVNRNMFRN